MLSNAKAIKQMKSVLIALLSAAALLVTPRASAQLSAYLPERGIFDVTTSYQFQRYRDFWVGGTRIGLETATGFEVQQQHSSFLTIEYGVLSHLALDVTLGYTWAEF